MSSPPQDAPTEEDSRSDLGRFVRSLLGLKGGSKDGALAGAPVTRLLIVANVLVFALEVFSSSGVVKALFGIPDTVVVAFGGNYPPFVLYEHRVEVWVASCFLHLSILHLGFNMYALRQVGPFVERAVGSARFFPMYMVSGIVGSATSTLMGFLNNPDVPSAGASGAICGAIGAALVLAGRTQGWRGPIVRSMGFWLLATFVLGVGIGADNAAHAGGALSGAAIAAVWRRGVVYRTVTKRVIVAVCTLVMVGSGAAVIYRNAHDPYAPLDEDDRVALAVSTYNAGDCAGAARAIDRAARLAPRGDDAERLAQITAHVERYCGTGDAVKDGAKHSPEPD